MDPAIDTMNRHYCDAYNAGDIEALLRFLADDAMTLSPDLPPVRGRAAHRDYFDAGLKREPLRELALTSIRSERLGEMLYDSGQWTNTVTSTDGSPRSARGYYVTIYRRDGDAWRAVTTTFNIAV